MVEGTAYQINETADDIINITNNSIVLIILEDQLKAALEAEDYEKASELKKKIDKIKNTSNNF
jgi:protein-arginine kinase activator protein McsA